MRDRCHTTLGRLDRVTGVTIWIDPPLWPAHGHLWSHLVSDTSYDELHAFAERVGIPARGFENDHYDVPEDRYDVLVAAGAQPTDAHDLVSRLNASGLRRPKRRGVRGFARVRGARVLGSLADVDLVESRVPASEAEVFAAMAFVAGPSDQWVVVHSASRGQWGPPGGWRELGESPAQCAAREVIEETGLSVGPADLVAVGFERFVWRSRPPQQAGAGSILQCFRVDLPRREELRPAAGEVGPAEWVSAAEFERRSAAHFWWPLAARIVADPPR